MSQPKIFDVGARESAVSGWSFRRQLTAGALVGVSAYGVWLLAQSPSEFLQLAFNGLAIGVIYAIMAVAFTIVYRTVWFFDMSLGIMPTIAAYTVFYLATERVNKPYINVAAGVIIGAAATWLLRAWILPRLLGRINNNRVLLGLVGLIASGVGTYYGFLLANPRHFNLYFSPAIGALAAVTSMWFFGRIVRRISHPVKGHATAIVIGRVGAIIIGATCALAILRSSSANLYLSWFAGVVLSGAIGLLLYRGLYIYIRRGVRSPLVPLVASIGVQLTAIAVISMIFTPDSHVLPQSFGTAPWQFGGASVKPLHVFFTAMLFLVFLGLLSVLKNTDFGKSVRAIGGDEELAKVVGINTSKVVSATFFVGAAIAGLAGIFVGQDTAIRPEMGILLLVKAFIASVVGGLGNLSGAVLGGILLGLIESYGVWYVASEWKDAIAALVLLLFLRFRTTGILSRG